MAKRPIHKILGRGAVAVKQSGLVKATSMMAWRRATVSQKAKALQKLGLVTIRKQGRRQVVRLINLST